MGRIEFCTLCVDVGARLILLLILLGEIFSGPVLRCGLSEISVSLTEE